MTDSSKDKEVNTCPQNKENCPDECKKVCICKSDKICYNNKDCCYLQPKDISIVQIYNPTLFQKITSYDNLCITDIPLEINTAGYIIESSSIKRPTDTLVINEAGIYSIYISLKYSFKFNEKVKKKDIFRVGFHISGNNKELFTMNNTIIVPQKVHGESEEIINTIQGKKLLIIEELPYKVNIALDEFSFNLTTLNQIIISDLILIVEKII